MDPLPRRDSLVLLAVLGTGVFLAGLELMIRRDMLDQSFVPQAARLLESESTEARRTAVA